MKSLLLFMALAAFGVASYAGNDSRVLESITEAERVTALAAIIHRVGRECGEVTQAFLQGYDKEDAAYWSVSCSNGQSYDIQVQSDPNAVSRVLECKVMKTMGLECFKKFSD